MTWAWRGWGGREAPWGVTSSVSSQALAHEAGELGSGGPVHPLLWKTLSLCRSTGTGITDVAYQHQQLQCPWPLVSHCLT